MGSVMVEDVGTDIARYPHHSSINDDLRDKDRNRSEKRQPPTNYRHNSQSSYPYTSVHHASAATPQLNTQNVSSAPFSQPSVRSSSSTSSRTMVEDGRTSARVAAPGSTSGSVASSLSRTAQNNQHSDAEPSYDLPTSTMANTPHTPVVAPPSPQLLPTVRSSLHLSQSSSGSPTRIKVRSLSHIQSFASEEALNRSQHSGRGFERRKPESAQYEISEMPVTDIIEMVAGLLTKITATNDRQHQHEHINRAIPQPEGTSAVSLQTASVLSFHGKNVPSITILSYLSRIHKYCPTTYEVFLSLLVYFDRMTEAVNKHILNSFKSAAKSAEVPIMSPSSTTSFQAEVLRAQNSRSGRPGTQDSTRSAPIASAIAGDADSPISITDSDDEKEETPHNFVVDSFNIHRLVIAGVTCASKFFSDVFYTNSRYAKVSTLRLNHVIKLLIVLTRSVVYLYTSSTT